MLRISHRGNSLGPNPEKENHPDYIRKTRANGFLVEIDVWWLDRWVLGHDAPQYDIQEAFFDEMGNTAIWHAKDSQALERLVAKKTHCFWHEDDDYTMTSNGYPWVYPKKRLFAGAICVMPELGFNGVLFDCAGICSDYILRYQKELCV
jgi:hypothetical protein